MPTCHESSLVHRVAAAQAGDWQVGSDAFTPELPILLGPAFDAMLAHGGTLAVMLSVSTAVPVVTAASETSPTALWALLVAALALVLSGFNTLRAVRKESNAKPHWVASWELGDGGLASKWPAVLFSAENRGAVEARAVTLNVGAHRKSLESVQTRDFAAFGARVEGWLSLSSEQVAVTESSMSPHGVIGPALPEGKHIHKRVYAQIEYVYGPDLHKPRKSKVWVFKA